MGKRRIVAETGAGQHGVAAATVCALLGLRGLGRTEAIITALESAHALGYLLEMAEHAELPAGSIVLLCLPGRGDKDLAIAAREPGVA
ncbi:hypothetical protein [Nocardia brevicatena]|uniref:hypothetical protein n=1 Tax=Nocardia brevicatena TaxID=37327 RepID=UPI0002FCFA9D|nr:hypothetical protein [Nocardia brevicatena]